MSILGHLAAVEMTRESILVLGFLLWTGFAVVLMFAFGVLRPRSVVGPPRWGDGEKPGTLFLLTMVGVFAWLTVPMFYAAYKGKGAATPTTTRASATMPATAPTTIAATTSTAPTTTMTNSVSGSALARYTPAELVYISSISAIVSFLVLIGANVVVRHDGLKRLGLDSASFVRAIPIAFLAMVIVLPLMGWASILTELLWQKLGIEHANEHDLLRILGQSDNIGLRAMIVFSATIFAPLAEETLFRGHIQTMFAMLFAGAGRQVNPLLDVLPIQEALEYAAPAPKPLRVGALGRFLGILIASLLFSAVHPWWSTPAIFFLSICLGYAYERTANLWVPILMHASFNAAELALFLSPMRPH